MFSKFIFLTVLVCGHAMASFEGAERAHGRGSGSRANREVILELVKGGYYFSVIPWMKNYLYLNKSPLDREMERAFDQIVKRTGVKIFESLPETILGRSKSGNIKYILAKRLLQKDRGYEALTELSRIRSSHPAFPFTANLKGTINSANNNLAAAENDFRQCIEASERRLRDADAKPQKEQLEANRDYCTAGIARVHFASRNYRKAESIYLDVPKDSFVWPEILFEEAWTSYYLGNYNRTLGKLVTYRAPVLDFVFKPEVEVLKALTYLRMCLYDDAKKTVDAFYDEMLTPSRNLRRFVLAHGTDYRTWYNLMADFEGQKQAPSEIVASVLKSIRKDAAYIEMKGAISAALSEYTGLKGRQSSTLRSDLLANLQTVLEEYQMTLGAYVRSGHVAKYAELYAAFQGMSYIKLEVLAQKKEQLYSSDQIPGTKRGDVKYIDRNDKQYFWNFNGEFWADELGDYVFALRTEC